MRESEEKSEERDGTFGAAEYRKPLIPTLGKGVEPGTHESTLNRSALRKYRREQKKLNSAK